MRLLTRPVTLGDLLISPCLLGAIAKLQKANIRRIKVDQLDVTRFIISPFNAQHVLNVSTSIFRSFTVDLFHVLYFSGSMCVGVTVWFGWGGVVSLCRLKHCFSLELVVDTYVYWTVHHLDG